METSKKCRIISVGLILLSIIVMCFISPSTSINREVTTMINNKTFYISGLTGTIKGENETAKFRQSGEEITLTFSDGSKAVLKKLYGNVKIDNEKYQYVAFDMYEAIRKFDPQLNWYFGIASLFLWGMGLFAIFKTETICKWEMFWTVKNSEDATPSGYLYYGTLFGGAVCVICGIIAFMI